MEKLRTNQGQGHTLSFFFHNTASKGIVLLVDRTGGGKSHTMHCAGVFLGGIILIVEPLLALTANLYGKFKCGSNAYCAIDAVHFDEQVGDDDQLRKQFIADIKFIHRDDERTVFVFVSPQKLKNTPTCELH